MPADNITFDAKEFSGNKSDPIFKKGPWTETSKGGV